MEGSALQNAESANSADKSKEEKEGGNQSQNVMPQSGIDTCASDAPDGFKKPLPLTRSNVQATMPGIFTAQQSSVTNQSKAFKLDGQSRQGLGLNQRAEDVRDSSAVLFQQPVPQEKG